MADYGAWTDQELVTELARLRKLKAWGPVATLERILRDRQPVELAQDAYYYGTAADHSRGSV